MRAGSTIGSKKTETVIVFGRYNSTNETEKEKNEEKIVLFSLLLLMGNWFCSPYRDDSEWDTDEDSGPRSRASLSTHGTYGVHASHDLKTLNERVEVLARCLAPESYEDSLVTVRHIHALLEDSNATNKEVYLIRKDLMAHNKALHARNSEIEAAYFELKGKLDVLQAQADKIFH